MWERERGAGETAGIRTAHVSQTGKSGEENVRDESWEISDSPTREALGLIEKCKQSKPADDEMRTGGRKKMARRIWIFWRGSFGLDGGADALVPVCLCASGIKMQVMDPR